MDTLFSQRSAVAIGQSHCGNAITHAIKIFRNQSLLSILVRANEAGTEWISAPKPLLTDDNYRLGTPQDVTLTNQEIVFDAPNMVRMGNDILAQISNSGNHLGFQWLKTILEPRGYRIHIAEKFYSYSHFDSTILPLRPGLVLFNSDRLSPDRYPEIFRTWDKIWLGRSIASGTTSYAQRCISDQHCHRLELLECE